MPVDRLRPPRRAACRRPARRRRRGHPGVVRRRRARWRRCPAGRGRSPGPRPVQGQRGREVDRRRGLADAALLVRDRQDPGLRPASAAGPPPGRPAPARAVSAARAIGVSSATSAGRLVVLGSSAGSVTASSFAVAVPLRSSGLAGVSAGARGASSVSRETSGDNGWGASADGSPDPPAAGRPTGLGAARGARPAAPSSSGPRGSGPVFHVKHRPAVALPSRRPRPPRRRRRPVSSATPVSSTTTASSATSVSPTTTDSAQGLPRSAGRPASRDRCGRSRRPRPVVPSRSSIGARDGPLEMTSSSGQPSPDDLIAPASTTTVHRRSVADEQLLEPGRGCRRPYAAGRSRGQAAARQSDRNPVTRALTRPDADPTSGDAAPPRIAVGASPPRQTITEP